MKFSDINPYYTVKGRETMAKKRKAAKAKKTARRMPPRHTSGPKKGQFKKRK